MEAGVRYQFMAYARVDYGVEVKGSPYGQIAIEWHDRDGKELSRIWGPTWPQNTSKLRWQMIQMSAEAPPGAASARFTILLNDGKPAGIWVLFVDDVSVITSHQ